MTPWRRRPAVAGRTSVGTRLPVSEYAGYPGGERFEPW
jgi:hypothetical protein